MSKRNLLKCKYIKAQSSYKKNLMRNLQNWHIKHYQLFSNKTLTKFTIITDKSNILQRGKTRKSTFGRYGDQAFAEDKFRLFALCHVIDHKIKVKMLKLNNVESQIQLYTCEIPQSRTCYNFGKLHFLLTQMCINIIQMVKL